MKARNVILLFACVALAARSFASAPVNGRVKRSEMVLSGENETLKCNYEYDSLGRMTRATLSPDRYKNSYALAYNKDTLWRTYTPGKSKDEKYILDARGYAVIQDDRYRYTYDSNGYRIRIYMGPAHSISCTINDGDIDTLINISGRDTFITAYTYYPEPEYRNYGLLYLGKSWRHLPKTDILTRHGKDTRTEHTYTFDTQGRVKTETAITTTPGLPDAISITTFTYVD